MTDDTSAGRRRFLGALSSLCMALGLSRSFPSEAADPDGCPCQPAPGELVGNGVSISIHPPEGGHYSKPVDITLESLQTGEKKTLKRYGKSSLFMESLEKGPYAVTVTAADFEVLTQKFEVCAGIVALPIYLRPKGWPVFHFGPSIVPFKPTIDTIALVFSAPFWRTEKFSDYLPELESNGLVPAGSDYIKANGEVVFLKARDPASSIFASSASAGILSKTENLFADVRAMFPAKSFGRLRIGVPVHFDQGETRILDNRFTVRFKPTDKDKITIEAKELEVTLQASVAPIPGFPDFWRVTFSSESNYFANLDKINKLLETRQVCSAEPDLLFQLKNSSLPDPSEDWYKCEDFIARQSIKEAWDLANGPGLGWSGITVASIDEGVFPDRHNDVNTGTLECYDLLYAYDPALGSMDVSCLNKEMFDSHGMQIYGIISAPHNGLGIAGIAPDCRHIAIRRSSEQGATQYASMLKWVAGVDGGLPLDKNDQVIISTPVSRRADIVNCSHTLALSPPDIVLATYEALALRGRGGKGCPIVYAAHETGIPDQDIQGLNFAALSPYPIIVSNTAEHSPSHWADGSPTAGPEVHDPSALVGWRIDLSAFGGVYPQSTTPQWSYGAPSLWDKDKRDERVFCRGQRANGIAPLGATSAAAAMVSGAAALVLSTNANLSWSDVKHILIATAEKIDRTCPSSSRGVWLFRSGNVWIPTIPPVGLRGVTYRSDWYGFGRLDVKSAVRKTMLTLPAPMNLRVR